jgi:Na+/melibiose symporter-like transporter
VQIGALVPELTLDYDERTSLSAYRLGVGNVISFIAVMTHAQIIKQWTGEDEAVGYRLSGAIFGTCITAAGWFTFWNIEEKFDPEVEDSEGERLTCMQVSERSEHAPAERKVSGVYAFKN